MDNEETIVTVSQPAPPESELHNEPLSQEVSTELDAEAIDDVQTVADEILVEVKECQNKLSLVTADLERLQSEGGPAKMGELQGLRTEFNSLREEMRNLLAELKELTQGRSPSTSDLTGSSQSIPLTSQNQPEVTITEINPAEVESAAERTVPSPKKKRYRI